VTGVTFPSRDNTMTSTVTKRAFRACSLSILIAGVAGMMLAEPASAADNAAAELQSAFEEAARDAKTTDDLGPAYMLLGIAETAQKQNHTQIALKAATTFAELVKRTAAKASLKPGSTLAENALAQFVDLRFVARTSNLPLPQAALDEAMGSLFPIVSTGLQNKIDEAVSWADKINYAVELGDLQASATQIMKEDVASTIEAAFEVKLTQLEKLAVAEADETERARMLEDVARARKIRDDRIIDAHANNLNIVAALMQRQSVAENTSSARARPASEMEVPEDLAAGTTSCIETAFTQGNSPELLRAVQLDCINSGRVPKENRCTKNNLAFLCYGEAPNGAEKITYVYRGTPEELYFQHKCPPGNMVKADTIAATDVAFRSAGRKPDFTCAPAGAE
jgi:hypothetical protein